MHKACLEDVFRTKNECPLCSKTILLGYEAALQAKKIAPNKVTRKKQNIDANLNGALRR